MKLRVVRDRLLSFVPGRKLVILPSIDISQLCRLFCASMKKGITDFLVFSLLYSLRGSDEDVFFIKSIVSRFIFRRHAKSGNDSWLLFFSGTMKLISCLM